MYVGKTLELQYVKKVPDFLAQNKYTKSEFLIKKYYLKYFIRSKNPKVFLTHCTYNCFVHLQSLKFISCFIWEKQKKVHARITKQHMDGWIRGCGAPRLSHNFPYQPSMPVDENYFPFIFYYSIISVLV